VSKPIRQILRLVAVVAIDAIIVWLYFKEVHVNATTVTFLLAILVVSATWGLLYAIVMAVVATLAYDYFFLPPLLRFIIADPQNWVALFAFLTTAIITSHLAERARREALQSNQRRQEVERLYSFSQQLLLTDNVFGLLNTSPLTSWTRSAWEVRPCSWRASRSCIFLISPFNLPCQWKN